LDRGSIAIAITPDSSASTPESQAARRPTPGQCLLFAHWEHQPVIAFRTFWNRHRIFGYKVLTKNNDILGSRFPLTRLSGRALGTI
jgi:hypothetical protein